MTRGEIWLANLDPRRGTEPGKTRPVLVVQAQALLDAGHPSTLILPLTTRLIDDSEPLRIRLEPQGQLERRSELLIDQMRAIDNARLVRGPITSLDPVAMARVDQALREVLDLAAPDDTATPPESPLCPKRRSKSRTDRTHPLGDGIDRPAVPWASRRPGEAVVRGA